MITESEIHEPLNLGSSELVPIDELVHIVEEIAGVKLERSYKLNAPKGVNGRNSDNTRIRHYLGWEPSITLREGLAKTYQWIESEMLPISNGRTSAFSVQSTAAPELDHHTLTGYPQLTS